MDLITLVALVAIVYGLMAIFERRPVPPPPFTPAPSGATETRFFSWQVEGVGQTYSLAYEVSVRCDQYLEAQTALLDGVPNKTYMTSDEECFTVAAQQINSDDFGTESCEVEQIVRYLAEVAESNYLSHYETSSIVLSFVHEQCISYEYDHVSKGTREYFRFPIETIYDTVGDCDCKAILACAIFKALNYDVAFALMPGHAALAISLGSNMPFANFTWAGREWYYCEATGDSWKPGVMPDEIDVRRIALREL